MPVLTDIRNNLLRFTTSTYVAEEPISIALSRKVKVAKPGGGHDKTIVALSPQNFRLVNQSAGNGIEFSGNDEGEVRTVNYIMVGNWDADVKEDDTWTEGDIQYHVDGVLPNNEFETRAFVTAFAKRPLHG